MKGHKHALKIYGRRNSILPKTHTHKVLFSVISIGKSQALAHTKLQVNKQTSMFSELIKQIKKLIVAITIPYLITFSSTLK